jgi:hypothetical protein
MEGMEDGFGVGVGLVGADGREEEEVWQVVVFCRRWMVGVRWRNA